MEHYPGPGMQAFLITFHELLVEQGQAGCSFLSKNFGLWIDCCIEHLCPAD